MSGKKNASSPIDDDCEYVASNCIDVTVIRSNDGKTSRISISLSSTLNALKDSVDSDATLGPIKREQQRLFYLGRELKSGNRSLSALGVGNHGVFTFHLLSCAPRVVDLANSLGGMHSHAADEKDDRKRTSNNIMEGNDSGGGSDNALGGGRGDVNPNPYVGKGNAVRQGRSSNFLDSDGSDVNDDDIVEIIEMSSNRKRRRS